MSDIIIHVWRGKCLPDPENYRNLRGVWDCLSFPRDKLANAERAYASFIRQGFHVEMVKPHAPR